MQKVLFPRSRVSILTLICVATILSMPILSTLATTFPARAAAAINGIVYRDYDYDGSRDAGEVGVAGILVTAYDAANTVQGTAVTSSNGSYILDAEGTGPYRVEFTNIPSYLESGIHGAQSGTSVQFVGDGEIGGVDLALHNPADYCQANPDMAISCFENGYNVGSDGKGFVSFPHNAFGDADVTGYTPPTGDATIGEVGTVWGSAYQRTTQRMYLASFLKRHSGLVDNPSTVYVLDYGTAGIPVTKFDLQGITPANGGAAIDLGSVCRQSTTDGDPDETCGNATDNALSTANTDPNIDIDAFGKIGKISYGDIEIDESGNALWLVNLNQQALISVDVSNPSALPGAVSQYPITGLAGSPDCSDGEYRPWGLGFQDGLGYLGGICSGEENGGVDDLFAFVHTFDPNNVAAGLTEVASFSLNYNREASWPDLPDLTSTTQHWNPWTDTWPTGFSRPDRGIYPQPIVGDIEFAADGSMIVGLMDRWGNQTGAYNYTAESGSTQLFGSASSGDIVHFCNNDGAYVMEGTTSDGFTCSPNEPASIQPVGAPGPGPESEVNDGPSGAGEYYPNDYLRDNHTETSLGALASLKRSGTIASVVFDPWKYVDTSGIHWYNTISGVTENAYEIVPSPDFDDEDNIPTTFGKAAGLGDLQLICDPAPIEIGNRVWFDANNNGIQDADEAPISDVVVTLYNAAGSAEIASTTTDGNGEYYFNNGNVTGGLAYDTTYQVRIELAQTGQATNALEGYQPTENNAASTIGDSNDDMRDSDGDSALLDGYSIATITTGGPGQNDHTIDFGFSQVASIGNFVWFDEDKNGLQGLNEVGIDGVTVELFGSNDLSQETTVTTNGGMYAFTSLIPGDYYVQFTLPDGTTWTQTGIGTNDEIDSDALPNADQTTARTEFTTLLPTEDDPTWDAGVIVDAAIDLEKQVQDPNEPSTWLDADTLPVSYLSGTQARYRFVITNIGTAALTSVVLDDPTPGVEGCPANLAVNLASVGGVLASTESITVEPAACLSPVLTGSEFSNTANVSAIPSLPDGTPIESSLELPTGTIPPVTAEDPANVTVIALASLGDTVWFDTNQDGVQDDTEPRLDGVQVELYNISDMLVDSTVTLNGGFYQFTELTPGDYYVVFTLPDGTTWTVPSIGADDVDSDAVADANPLTARTIPTTLTATENDPTWDAGVYVDASILLEKQVLDPIDGVTWHDADASAVTFATGEQARYRFVITNNGNSSLTDVVLNDATPSIVGCPNNQSVDLAPVGGVLDPNESLVIEPTACLSPVLGDSGFINTADVSGQPSLPDGTPTETALDLPQGTISRVTDDDPASVGTRPLSTIGDRVWYDANRDGVQNTDESTLGVANVLVELLSGTGSVIDTVTTDESGNYLFAGLEPETYSLRFTLPNGTTWTSQDADSNDNADSDVDQSTGETIQTLLAPLEVDPNWDAGLIANPSVDLEKQVQDPTDANNWFDADSQAVDYPVGSQGRYRFVITNNGSTSLINVVLDDPTVGVAGCPIQLGIDLNDTTISDGNGVLSPGESLTIEPANCLSPILDGNGFINEANVQATASQENGNPLENALGLPSGTIPAVTDRDPASIGNVALASIGDKVWLDLNIDGIQGTDEVGVQGVTVELYDSSGVRIETATTDVNGMYQFDGLEAGDYSLIFIPPAGYGISPENSGINDAIDSDIDPVTGSVGTVITLDPGENDPTWDAGVYLVASIGNTVWLDVNSDGLQNSNEPGVAGVTVQLFQPDTETPVATTVTSDDGTYIFNNLLPGDYYIQIVPPDGVEITTLDSGANDSIDSDVDPTTGQTIVTNLSSGENDPTWDAGLITSITVASLGNYVWLDTNANGVQDDDEQGLAGVTVFLYSEDGSLIDTTNTGSDGQYLFSNLAPGNYYVQFSRPNMEQYFFSQQNAADSNTDSNANPTTGRTVSTELVGGENDLTWDAGIYTPPLLSINKIVIQETIQPGDPINYMLTYENSGLATAKNVVITERIPVNTTWDRTSSSDGWICQDNRIEANTICTYPVGDIPPETKGNLELSFVVQADQFLPEDVTVIQNEAFISDDNQNGSVLVGQSSGMITVPIIRPTALDAISEPNQVVPSQIEMTEFIFVPLIR